VRLRGPLTILQEKQHISWARIHNQHWAFSPAGIWMSVQAADLLGGLPVWEVLGSDFLRDYFKNQRFYHKESWLIFRLSLHSHEMSHIYNQPFPQWDCFGQVIYFPVHITLTYPAIPQNISIFHTESDGRILMFATGWLFSQKLMWNLITIDQATGRQWKNSYISKTIFFFTLFTNATLVSSITYVHIWMHAMTSIYCQLWVACKLNNK